MSDGTGRLAARPGLASWLEDDDPGNRRAAFVRQFLTATVVVSVFGVVLGTVAELDAAYGRWFRLLEDVALAIFAAEYVLRLWSAPYQLASAGIRPAQARLAYALSTSGLIDLLTILPGIIGVVGGGRPRILLLLRVLRFFKLARYSPGMRSLALVLQAERKALLASSVILLGFVLLAASAIYAAEADSQPDKLGSIPAAMWWAIVTLTTVGYGDVYPLTVAGRMVASITMVFGLMMLALPVGIVATAFAEEIHRREFVVTWGMIARIPLFATLSAGEIGDITRFLHARTVPAGSPIVLKGDRARSMFVIASGEVEVELPGGAVRLGEGQFFGERAMFENASRNATVRATQPTRLLVLEKEDLHRLLARNPQLRARVRSIALARQDANQDQAGG